MARLGLAGGGRRGVKVPIKCDVLFEWRYENEAETGLHHLIKNYQRD